MIRNARFFSLQVVEETVRRKLHLAIAPEKQLALRQTLWTAMLGSTNSPQFIRNKLCVIVVLLFKRHFQQWESFFDDLLSLLDNTDDKSRIELFLRLCATIDEEIVAREALQTAEDASVSSSIKDAMRVGPIQRLVSAWILLLRLYFQSDTSIACQCITLLGSYASWIDIHLVVQQELIEALLSFLQVEQLRIAACDALAEIVGKGMSCADKLQLLHVLQMPATLLSMSADAGNATEFDAHVAKLLHNVFLALCDCLQTPDDSSMLSQVSKVIQDLFPCVAKYFALPDDQVASTLHPVLSSYVLALKRQKQPLTDIQRSHLVDILQMVIAKLRYSDDCEKSCLLADDEDEQQLLEYRKQLRGIMEPIAVIDPDLFTSSIVSLVDASLDAVIGQLKTGKSVQQAIEWQDAELVLYIVFVFIEAKPFKTAPVYIDANGVLCPLGKMLTKVLESNIFAHPHGTIPLLFFEIVVRYNVFFEKRPEFFAVALHSFVGTNGLHHSDLYVRTRTAYLLLRLAKTMKMHMVAFLQPIMDALADLLGIKERTHLIALMNSDGLVANSTGVGLVAGAGNQDDEETLVFESQMFLFEAVGLVVSCADVAKQVSFLQQILSPVIYTIETTLNNLMQRGEATDALIMLLRDSMTAVGCVCKGFPDSVEEQSSSPLKPTLNNTMDQKLTLIFKETLQRILFVLQQSSHDSRIREATRFALQRMVGCVGRDILDQLPSFLAAGLLSNTSTTELIEFIPFLCLVIHKFKDQITNILIDIWSPLRESLFVFLNRSGISGTDDLIELGNLRRSYLTIVSAFVVAGLQHILTCANHLERLNATLSEILACLDDKSDLTTYKLVFGLLAKIVYIWAAGANPEGQETGSLLTFQQQQSSVSIGSVDTVNSPLSNRKKKNTGSRSKENLQRCPIAGFNQFFYDVIVPKIFEIPLRPGFDMKDAQSVVIIGEIASIHKTAFEILGREYLDFLSSYLTSSGCSDAVSQNLLNALVREDKKDFKRSLQVCFPKSSLYSSYF